MMKRTEKEIIVNLYKSGSFINEVHFVKDGK